MKGLSWEKILQILIMSLLYWNTSFADDIRNFKIEEMSIGDSALDYFTKNELQNKDDTYFEGSWYQDNANLNEGAISAITNTNYETGIEYELNLVFVSANISYDDELLTNGMDATNLVTATIVENESIYGDNVDISIKLNILLKVKVFYQTIFF